MRRRSFGAATGLCQLLMLLVGAISTSAQDNCILNFIEQPQTVGCLIYEEELIELTCAVSSEGLPDSLLSADPEDFNVRWYFNNGTEHQLMVGIDVIRTGGNGEVVVVRSTLGISAISPQANVASLDQGSYYCRVEVDEQTMLSNSSQPFIVLEEDAYLQAAVPCTDMSFNPITESACAVHKITEESTTANSDPVTSHFDATSSLEEDGASTTSTDTTTPPSSSDPGRSGGGSPLQVWIYVLVAVAAVFAMIIIILAIMCVGLCLRRSQSTMDSANYNKENGGIQGNFHLSHSSSMVNNEMYRGAGMGTEEADFTGTHGTHFTSHSQISDDNYNTLGERDYEVINVKPSCDPSSCDNTQDYHRLQRPSPPAVPTGRNAMFGFSPPNGEFRSMSTLTSQMNGMSATCSFHQQKSFNSKPGYSTLPLISSRDPPPPYNGNAESHVYRELENPATTLPAGHFPNGGGSIYRSPTSSSPPDSAKYFEHSDSTTELLPPALPARGATTNRKTSDASLNESLYNPCLGGAGQSPHPLEKIPETGTMFPEPPNPTSFPVNEYDYIPTMSEYEKPVASKGKPKKVGENPKTRVSTKSMNYETDPNLELRGNNDDTADCTADSTDMTGGSITGFKLPLADDDVTADSSDFTGASDMHFPIGLKQNGTTVSNELPSADFTDGSLTGGCRTSVLSTDYTGASEDDNIIPVAKTSTLDNPSESKKNFQMNGMCYPDNRRSQSRERCSASRERRSFSREAPSLSQTSGGGIEDNNTNEQFDNDNNIINSLPAAVPPPYIIAAGNRVLRSTPPPPSSSTLPQSRPNPYKELDTSSLKAHMNYTKLRVGPGTVV